jgi:spore maturation protein CgeB
MRIVLFCHSLLSDWNHGNAHFLRGLVSELAALGHQVKSLEPVSAWSVQNLIEEAGHWPLREVFAHYPALDVERYEPGSLDLDRATDGADLVIAHEWNAPELITALGRRRSRGARYRLLLHDTHHRGISDAGWLSALDLSGYDGVLAFGEALRQRYLDAGWARRVWTFHEAADVHLFSPMPSVEANQDLVWIGNWGDGERSRELAEFVFEPVASLGISATVYGVRYPREGLEALARAGIEYGGWLANYRVPETFARHRVTLHVPRRPYIRALPGIPTIRMFEALASGIPLVAALFDDVEGLFGREDFLRVDGGDAMRRALRFLLEDRAAACELAARGRATILTRHTTAHRAAQLLSICDRIGVGGADPSGRVLASNREAGAWD